MDNEHVCVYYCTIYCAAHLANKAIPEGALTREDLDIADHLFRIYRDEVSASVGGIRFYT